MAKALRAVHVTCPLCDESIVVPLNYTGRTRYDLNFAADDVYLRRHIERHRPTPAPRPLLLRFTSTLWDSLKPGTWRFH